MHRGSVAAMQEKFGGRKVDGREFCAQDVYRNPGVKIMRPMTTGHASRELLGELRRLVVGLSLEHGVQVNALLLHLSLVGIVA